PDHPADGADWGLEAQPSQRSDSTKVLAHPAHLPGRTQRSRSRSTAKPARMKTALSPTTAASASARSTNDSAKIALRREAGTKKRSVAPMAPGRPASSALQAAQSTSRVPKSKRSETATEPAAPRVICDAP